MSTTPILHFTDEETEAGNNNLLAQDTELISGGARI